MDYRELSEELTKVLREKVDKEIDAIVWFNKQNQDITFEVTYIGFSVEAEICSGFVSNGGEVEFYRKSSGLPLSDTTNLTPYQITKTRKLVKKFLEETSKTPWQET